MNDDTGIDAVTGAFSYSGSAIAKQLLAAGRRVRTLTGHPERGGRADEIEVRPLDFDDPSRLDASLAGVANLYNTYWVRFAQGRVDHALAVENSAGHCSGQREQWGSPRSSICRSFTRRQPRLTPTSWQGPGRKGARRERPCLRCPAPFSALRRAWGPANNSPGCSDGSPSSLWAATGSTGCGPSTSMTWPPWRSRRPPGPKPDS